MQGPYSCAHCHQPHAQWGRFVLYRKLENGDWERNQLLSFCCPECAAGFNLHTCTDDDRQDRHVYLEKVHGRKIPAAIARKDMTVARETWLKFIRRNLMPEEWKLIEKEMRIKINIK